jgi:putative phage-type endonuclease
MADVVQLDQRRAWLRERRRGLGASDAAAVLGLSPYSNPFVVWLDKTGRLPLDHGAEEPEKRWGRFLEGAIAEAFEEETGLRVIDRELSVIHPEHSWLRATLDGRVTDGTAVLGVYEAKTTNGRDGTWRDGPPEWYVLQVQHQLLVTALDRAWLPVLIGGSDFEVHQVERDERVIALLLAYESAFWHDHVLAGVPPPLDSSERTGDALRSVYARPGAESVELPDATAAIVDRYIASTARAKRAEADVQRAKNELMALLGEAEVGLVGGRPLVRWPLIAARRLDQRALAAAHPDIVEKFTRPAPYRRLAVTKETA